MKWFRLYSEVLHDPKVQRLSSALFKHWINLLCLANESDTGGLLPCEDDIAFALRIKPSEAHTVMAQLRQAGLMDQTPEGRHFPHNWPQRQRQSDDVASRVRLHRDKKSLEYPTSEDTSNGHVTLHETLLKREVDTDTDTEKKRNVRVAAAVTDAPAVTLVGAADAAADVASRDEVQESTAQTSKPKVVFGRDTPAFQLAQRLTDAIRRHKPDARLPSDLQRWCAPMELAMRLDGRTFEQLAALIDWLPTNEFWRKNILSAGTFREKLDRLEMQREDDQRRARASPARPMSTTAAFVPVDAARPRGWETPSTNGATPEKARAAHGARAS
jgi:hypothetical protein